jgi:hypothetical protein
VDSSAKVVGYAYAFCAAGKKEVKEGLPKAKLSLNKTTLDKK